MKKLLLLLLALPMLTTAQEKTVQVPYSCDAGNEFTIRIPVKTRGMSVEYVWYRNDTVVATAPMTAGVTAISYTIPADKAYGDGDTAAFHFKYRLNDGCDVWSRSPRYVVTFQPIICPAIPGAIGFGDCTAPGTVSVGSCTTPGTVGFGICTNPGTVSVSICTSPGAVGCVPCVTPGTIGLTAN